MTLPSFTLNNAWDTPLSDELRKDYMYDLRSFLDARYHSDTAIFPDKDHLFRAFDLTAPQDIRVVILGQDPYHGAGQAHGLCFSVQRDVKIPPSLRNIYKELHSDLGIAPASHGCLEEWAKQGVFLLNSVLSVEQGKAGSHQGHGWEDFTDAVIAHINTLDQPIVFMLWGAPAQKKATLLDNANHLILKAPHPSPLSAHRGFLGCKHFSQVNDFLKKNNIDTVDWALTDAQGALQLNPL